MDFVPDPRRKLYIETTGVCNLACRFCPYSKKRDGKVTMTMGTFCDVVDQATEMGFREFGLTPLTGEPFMDSGFIEKLRALEARPRVDGYHFYTNFTIPNACDIGELASLTKLQYMHISLYGHDLETFQSITRKPGSAYTRLVRNLETLYETLQASPSRPWIRMSWRTTKDFCDEGDLPELVGAIQQRCNLDVPVTTVYNNWGGAITESDLEGLDMVLAPAPVKDAPCALIFYRLIVLADGRVNACACRDVDGTLVIGNVHESPLAWILSTNNPRYAEIIQEQIAHHFRPVCRACDFYQSIAVRNKVLEESGFEPAYRSLNDALRQLSTGAPLVVLRQRPDSEG
jgi:MoaA/NifB/PqqE/SkfB family radical SAM enzyme